jgi:hypothetical protein
MDKLDLVLLPFVYVLRMTPPLFLLAGSQLCHFYDYWFHTCENAVLCADLLVWFQFIICHVFCFSLHVVHILLKLIVALVQSLPLWNAMAFWPWFYWGILASSNRRYFRDMFVDPRCQQSQLAGRSPVSCLTRRRCLARNIIHIQPMQRPLGCISHYEVRGAYDKKLVRPPLLR